MRISHEIGGSAMRRAIAERALGFEFVFAIRETLNRRML
jgi:hypothetical protein